MSIRENDDNHDFANFYAGNYMSFKSKRNSIENEDKTSTRQKRLHLVDLLTGDFYLRSEAGANKERNTVLTTATNT